MADYKTLIKDKNTQKWLKASIAINITKNGLSDFVNDIAGQLQKKILADVQKNNHLPVSATCNTCRTGNVVQCPSTRKCPNTCTLHKDTSITYKVCPNLICHNFAPELSKYHRFHKPSWKNTESTKWCTSAWEIAKCFHPPDGYLDKADASVTDFNGVVSVIINCKEFDNHVNENLTDNKNIFVKSRDVVKGIRHTATLQVEDAELQDVFTTMRAILSDTQTLSGNTQAQEAMKKLSSLEADTLTITTEDVFKLIQKALNDTQNVISDASHVSEEAKRTNEKTKELQSKLDVLNNKEEELKKLLEAFTDIRDKAMKDVEHTGELVTKTVTENITSAGHIERSRVKETGQAVKQDVEHVGEHVIKEATEKLKIAGQMEDSRVKETGQAVKQDVEHAGEHVIKEATEKLKIAGQMEDSLVKETGQTVKQDVKHTGEITTKAAIQKIKTAGQMEETGLKEAGRMVKQALKEENEKVAADTRDEMTEEAYGIIRATKSEVGEMKTKICEELETEKNRHITDMGISLNETADEIVKIRKHDMGISLNETADEIVKKRKQGIVGEAEQVRKKKTSMLGRMFGKIGFSTKKSTKYQALKKEKEMVVADARDEMTEEAYGIIGATKSEVGEMKTKICEELETEKNRHITAIRTQEKNTADENYEEKKNDLRHALANHYLTEHDSLPLSPLMPEVDDKLIKFYMAPKMNKVDTKSSTKSVQTTEHVKSYKSMFYNDNNLHKNIYIQGEAGIGKSTFCTKLGLVWSEKYCTEKNLTERSKKESSLNKSTVKQKETREFSDVSIIYEFDFVFALALRNVEGECEIGKMIQTQIISELTDDEKKYGGLVPEILDKERCLIILDGLDEWSHQINCKKSRRSLVPHRKSWSNTTVLTSTRPWKMNEVRLRDSEISPLIQVTGITDSETFIENVLNCLNDKYQTNRVARDFIAYMKHKKLEHFLDIPVVAMQLLWLWHSGHELGDSKCQIYINMLDMLFGRAEEKSPSACDDITDSSKVDLPPCFESTEFCEQHKMLLDWLGSLAFHTLYSSKREETLVFSESIVENHVKSTAARKTALTTGILSQHKSPSRNKRTSHFSFLHKTFQEFLAAYFIATHVDESENIVQTLFQVYGQTVDIMDISELFIFVCGLNTEMSCKISDSVMKSFSVKLTNHIEELHISDGFYRVQYMTESLQEMILAGYKESINNGHQDRQLALHHVYYNRDISGDDKIYQDRLVDRNKDKIVTLSAERCTVDVLKIQQILAQSSSTLSHVGLVSVKDLTDASLDLFTNITLKSLNLQFTNTHFDIKLNTSSLLYCFLHEINKEVEHSVLSALTTAPKLHTLDVRDCKNMSVLCQVLPTLPMLHRLYVSEEIIPASLCQVMSTLSQLQRLCVTGIHGCEDLSLLCQLPSTLSNLQYIGLGYIDLGDNDILLPNSIQEINLHHMTLTCRSFRQLVDRLTEIPHKVTCELWWCTVRPKKELQFTKIQI